ncbi:MAG: MerR family transcriptional regulator [Ectothiorhodospiraceae bacterium]|nr:MerR family transcriptional regulator [Ectothiorhodospiraceae bacterium]MCH8506684.1 MerR family transcriptional regulator [Ectothiorhodospiraceae bacterium]
MSKGLYPIRTISAMTGVNPVTLRAWERRYGLIRPQRTPKGHRLYTERDIDRIQQILVLLERGIPISQAEQALDRGQPQTESAATVTETDVSTWDEHRQRWDHALSSLDDLALEQAYGSALGLFPVDQVMRRIATPLLEETRKAGEDDPLSRGRFHFLKSFLRNKLCARFHHQLPYSSGPKLLLATVDGHCDDYDLMQLAVAAQGRGYRCIMLGTDVSSATLARALGTCRCAGLVLGGSRGKAPPDDLLETLAGVNAPAFLLSDAADWVTEGSPDHLLPVPSPDMALQIIGRHIPPVTNAGLGRSGN